MLTWKADYNLPERIVVIDLVVIPNGEFKIVAIQFSYWNYIFYCLIPYRIRCIWHELCTPLIRNSKICYHETIKLMAKYLNEYKRQSVCFSVKLLNLHKKDVHIQIWKVNTPIFALKIERIEQMRFVRWEVVFSKKYYEWEFVTNFLPGRR